MQKNYSRVCLTVLFYGFITIICTLWLLEKYGAQIIAFQMGNSFLYAFVLAQKSVESGLPGWDALLPLTTFLVCLAGGVVCAWLCGIFLQAYEYAIGRIASRVLSVHKVP